MHEVIDASVGDGLEELLAERALASEHLAEADLAALRRSDGRGAGPPPPAALHRAGVPGGVHTARRRIAQARAGPLRDRQRARAHPRTPARARSPPATTASPSTSSHVQPDDLRPRRPARARPPAARRRDGRGDPQLRRRASNAGTVLVSSTLEEPQLLVGVVEEVADAHRRLGRPPLRLRLRRRASAPSSAAGPAPYLDCVAAPDGPARRRRPRAAVARRRRGQGDELDHRQPAARVPGRGPAAPGRRARARRATWSPSASSSESERLLLDAAGRVREGAGRREAQGVVRQPEPQGRRPRGAAAQRASRCSTSSSSDVDQAAARRHRRARAARSGCVEGETPARRADPRHGDEGGRAPRRRPRPRARARARPQAGRAGVQQPRLRRPLHRRRTATPIRIEVKARIAGAEDFFVTHNEVDDRQERRSALPARARARRPARRRSTTRSATSTTRSPASTSATSTPPGTAGTGTGRGRRGASRTKARVHRCCALVHGAEARLRKC